MTYIFIDLQKKYNYRQKLCSVSQISPCDRFADNTGKVHAIIRKYHL